VNVHNVLEARRAAHVAGEQVRVAVQQAALREAVENGRELLARHHFAAPHRIAGVVRQIDAVDGVDVEAVQLQRKHRALVAHVAVHHPRLNRQHTHL
jgi:hypothetical protein